MMHTCMVLLGSEFEDDGFNSDILMSMKEIENPSYVLDLKSMWEAKLNNEVLIKIVKNHLQSSEKNDTVYAYKTVEDIELVHKNR